MRRDRETSCIIKLGSSFTILLVMPFCHLPAQEIDFNRTIRPILSDTCFPCHGPDANSREAELRLDFREGAFEDRGGYAAFVPNKPDESEALRRVLSEDPDEQMPPPDSKLSLTEPQKEQLRRWVEQGAPWNKHWSFVPPAKPEPPSVIDVSWPTNDLDRFVLARLEREGFRPALIADRETLIRRVTLDLTGLPPTLNEIDEFLADDSENAYEKVVDRLLRSPKYGERMAWDWLDSARYADTDGFQGDPTREMWPWRDWLIRALNENKRFDEFTIEMLAGDLLPNATLDQVIATGFNRNHMYNGEGGRIPEETRVENVFDRTETTSTVWLGLTMTCARCHDHKYDPITQREYYQLFAFFNNTSESGRGGRGKAPPVVRYYSRSQSSRLKEIRGRIADIHKRMTAPNPALDAAQSQWEAYTTTKLGSSKAASKPVEYGDWWVVGTIPAADGDGDRVFSTDLGPERGVDLSQKYADGRLSWRQEPRFTDGKVHPLPEKVGATYLYRTIQTEDPRTVDVSLGSDDGIKVWLNGKELLSKNVTRGAAPDQDRVSLSLKPGENQLLLKIINTGGIAGFYFRPTAVRILGLPQEVSDALLVASDKRTAEQRDRLRTHYRENHWDEWNKLAAEKDKLAKEEDRIEQSGATVMVMDSLPDDKQRTTNILSRGTYNKPLEAVTVGTPAFLPPLKAEDNANRLALARWLVSADNPLTARVTVNRYWQLFFGRGLVTTTEDFGRQGALPTHPMLLDWLATSFVDSGWDVKGIHKQIVMSSTYRQSSRSPSDPDGEDDDRKRVTYDADPDNRLLGRGPRFRMPSWMLRDTALASGGLLVEEIGGPSVRPYQPPGIWAEATFNKIRYQQDSGASLYRRSLYTFWRRIVGPTMFFDSAKRQACEVKQSRTNTPLHALTTLNETTFVESARAMASRIVKSDGEPAENAAEVAEDRLVRAFRLATSRYPDDEELDVLRNRLEDLRESYRKQPDQATSLLSVGESARDETIDPIEHAAYTVLCSLLLNLDEALSKE